MEKKGLSFFTIISTVICVVFVCEAAAPAAAIGNQQFFWWIFLIITFLIPYGLAVAELGTAYESDGGIIDWIRDGLGDKWAARAAYYYWVNYPFWIASLATLFPYIMTMISGYTIDFEANIWVTLAIELAFTWIVTFMAFSPVSDSEWVLNGGAIIKVAVAVIVGCVGIWFAATNGFASDMSPATFLPDLSGGNALGYLSIIIFNFMGFEVICTMTGDMKDPKHEIPRAVILGGIAIAVIYLFASFGIGAAIPADQIDPDFGMVVALETMVGNGFLFKLVAVLFLITMFANMASWSFGVNSVAAYAAQTGNMPRSSSASSSSPTSSSPTTSSGCSSACPSSSCCSPTSPCSRGAMFKVALIVPMIELIAAVIATVIPLSAEEVGDKVPMIIGLIVFLVIGEIFRIVSAKGRTEEYKGLTPELAAQRNAEEAAAAEAEE